VAEQAEKRVFTYQDFTALGAQTKRNLQGHDVPLNIVFDQIADTLTMLETQNFGFSHEAWLAPAYRSQEYAKLARSLGDDIHKMAHVFSSDAGHQFSQDQVEDTLSQAYCLLGYTENPLFYKEALEEIAASLQIAVPSSRVPRFALARLKSITMQSAEGQPSHMLACLDHLGNALNVVGAPHYPAAETLLHAPQQGEDTIAQARALAQIFFAMTSEKASHPDAAPQSMDRALLEQSLEQTYALLGDTEQAKFYKELIVKTAEALDIRAPSINTHAAPQHVVTQPSLAPPVIPFTAVEGLKNIPLNGGQAGAQNDANTTLYRALDHFSSELRGCSGGGLMRTAPETLLRGEYSAADAEDVGTRMQRMLHPKDKHAAPSKEDLGGLFTEAHALLGTQPRALYYKAALEQAAGALGLPAPGKGKTL
jgi:hypothetical protein